MQDLKQYFGTLNNKFPRARKCIAKRRWMIDANPSLVLMQDLNENLPIHLIRRRLLQSQYQSQDMDLEVMHISQKLEETADRLRKEKANKKQQCIVS